MQRIEELGKIAFNLVDKVEFFNCESTRNYSILTQVREKHAFVELVLLAEMNIRNITNNVPKIISVLNRKKGAGVFTLTVSNSLQYQVKFLVPKHLAVNEIKQVLVLTIRSLKKVLNRFAPAFAMTFPDDFSILDILTGCKNITLLRPSTDSIRFAYDELEFNLEISILNKVCRQEQLKQVLLLDVEIDFIKQTINFRIEKKKFNPLNRDQVSSKEVYNYIEHIFDLLNQVSLFPDVPQLLQNLVTHNNKVYVFPKKKLCEFLFLDPTSEKIKMNLPEAYISFAYSLSLSLDFLPFFKYINAHPRVCFGNEYSAIEIPAGQANRYQEFASILHENMLDIYGIYKDTKKYYLITAHFDPNSFASHFADCSPDNFSEFYQVLLQVLSLIIYCSARGIYKLYICEESLHYSDGRVKLIPRFHKTEDFLIFTPEELSEEYKISPKNEMFRVGMLIYKIALEKFNNSAALDRFSARCNTFESYQDLMVNEEKNVPISAAVQQRFPFLVSIVRELCSHNADYRMDAESLISLLKHELG